MLQKRILACWVVVLSGTIFCARSESDPSSVTLEKLLTEGQEAFLHQQYEKALQAYEKALQKQPNSAVVYNLIGMAYRFQYNETLSPDLKRKEIAAFAKAVEIQPDFFVALVNLGSSYYFDGKKKEAAPYFRRVLDRMPNHPEAEQLKKMAEEGEAEDEKKP
jgi:tetratricopeptide (TPR) repeat protein